MVWKQKNPNKAQRVRRELHAQKKTDCCELIRLKQEIELMR